MSETSHRYHSTRVRVTFHRHDGQPIRLLDGEGASDVAEVVALQTSKHFGEAAGSWTLTLKRRHGIAPSFLTQFPDKENNWVHIEWLVNGEIVEALWGLTDTMVENVKRDPTGGRVETVMVTGRDHGKVFDATDLFINIYERGNVLPMFPLYRAVHESLIGSPDEIVKSLVRAWLGNAEATGPTTSDKPWQLPGSIFGDSSRHFFYDWLNTQHVARTRGQIIAPTLYNVDQQGKLWDTIQEYANGCLNEVWCDLAPDRNNQWKPALIMRERAFPTIKSQDRWLALPKHRLLAGAITERHLVGDGNGRFNYWTLRMLTLAGSGFSTGALIQSAGNRSPGQPGSVPIYDVDSIRKHGVRRYEQSTRYVPVDEASQFAGQDGGPQWLRIVTQWTRIIHDWYVVAPLQLTGSITTAGVHPKIRLGHRVIEERNDRDGSPRFEWEYYVEGVDHHWQYGAHGSTTLAVTRGAPVESTYLREQYSRYVTVDVDSMRGDDIEPIVSAAATAAAADAGVSTTDIAGQDEQLSTEPEADAPVESTGIASEADPGEETDVEDRHFVQIEEPFTITPRAPRKRRGPRGRGRGGGGMQ